MKMKPVNPRAVSRRINRLLEPVGMSLRKCRHDSRWSQDLGEFYIIDVTNNSVDRTHVCLDALADEFDVLRRDEFLCWPEEEGKVVTG